LKSQFVTSIFLRFQFGTSKFENKPTLCYFSIMATGKHIIPNERIVQCIFVFREQKVMFARDLAMLYGVETKVLNQAVQRNKKRFPPDFAFQLTAAELSRLMSQFVTSKGRGGVRKSPYVFTEHGALMAANVLRSRRAIEMSVFVVRAFTHHELSHVSVLTKHCPQDKAILDSLGDS